MLSAFTNSLKIPELRQKIFFTLALLFIARVGANIPLPGVDPSPIKEFFELREQTRSSDEGNDILGFYNMFTGGALLNGALFALGIMPYISASIIMQLMGAVLPQLARLQQEGEPGRQKISQYTRYLTIFICMVQGGLLAVALRDSPGSLIQGFNPLEIGMDGSPLGRIVPLEEGSEGLFLFNSIIFLTTGSLILMWLGEQITQRGIGNGISLLITVGILADLPKALADAYTLIFEAPSDDNMVIVKALLMIFLFLLVVGGIIAVTQAQRKIPVQYAKRMVGRKVFGGQSSFLPLKVNYAGVMPVIFASAILMFPAQLLRTLGAAIADSPSETNWAIDLANVFASRGWFYYLVYGGLILVFSYFWVSIMFKPVQIADDLKKNGGYVPGVRPGDPTARFLDFTMTRLTLAGAIFLTAIAVFPDFIFKTANVSYNVATFFGGTGMLIIVGVVLDTMRQVETFLLQRHYDGFLRKGRIRGRSGSSNQRIESLELKAFEAEWRPLIWISIFLFVVGLIGYFLKDTNLFST
ncbi:MAG: preprotein translocase subunit SecY [Opitutae bacterium]|nr:preprotein translocase subunit SecY [Opitutae bacterium]|tara:strand:- start:2306 stop:3883 length:1578 start_codon:yes stop_codon:yes gene_type:complete